MMLSHVPSKRLVSTIVKVARTAILTCFAVALSTLPAVAATRRASSALFSSDAVKYGALGVVMLAGSMFSKAPPPTLIETVPEDGVDPIVESPESLEGEAQQSPQTADPLAVLEDDGMLFTSLAGRMQALAEERRLAEQAEEANDQLPTDSSDGWGEGSTAVLEPPKPGHNPAAEGVLDGEPPVEFPTGFPLVDGEVVQADTMPATLSDDELAKLKRMMGTSE